MFTAEDFSNQTDIDLYSRIFEDDLYLSLHPVEILQEVEKEILNEMNADIIEPNTKVPCNTNPIIFYNFSKDFLNNFIKDLKDKLNVNTSKNNVYYTLSEYLTVICNNDLEKFKSIRQSYYCKEFGFSAFEVSLAYNFLQNKSEIEKVFCEHPQLQEELHFIKEDISKKTKQSEIIKYFIDNYYNYLLKFFNKKIDLLIFLEINPKLFYNILREIKDQNNFLQSKKDTKPIDVKKHKILSSIDNNFVNLLREDIKLIKRKINQIIKVIDRYYQEVCDSDLKKFKLIPKRYFCETFDFKTGTFYFAYDKYLINIHMEKVFLKHPEVKNYLISIKEEISNIFPSVNGVSYFINNYYKIVEKYFPSKQIMRLYFGLSAASFQREKENIINNKSASDQLFLPDINEMMTHSQKPDSEGLLFIDSDVPSPFLEYNSKEVSNHDEFLIKPIEDFDDIDECLPLDSKDKFENMLFIEYDNKDNFTGLERKSDIHSQENYLTHEAWLNFEESDNYLFITPQDVKFLKKIGSEIFNLKRLEKVKYILELPTENFQQFLNCFISIMDLTKFLEGSYGNIIFKYSELINHSKYKEQKLLLENPLSYKSASLIVLEKISDYMDLYLPTENSNYEIDLIDYIQFNFKHINGSDKVNCLMGLSDEKFINILKLFRNKIHFFQDLDINPFYFYREIVIHETKNKLFNKINFKNILDDLTPLDAIFEAYPLETQNKVLWDHIVLYLNENIYIMSNRLAHFLNISDLNLKRILKVFKNKEAVSSAFGYISSTNFNLYVKNNFPNKFEIIMNKENYFSSLDNAINAKVSDILGLTCDQFIFWMKNNFSEKNSESDNQKFFLKIMQDLILEDNNALDNFFKNFSTSSECIKKFGLNPSHTMRAGSKFPSIHQKLKDKSNFTKNIVYQPELIFLPNPLVNTIQENFSFCKDVEHLHSPNFSPVFFKNQLNNESELFENPFESPKKLLKTESELSLNNFEKRSDYEKDFNF